jgi:bifunctional diaminopimelate decarboxylase / aspartate kinase
MKWMVVKFGGTSVSSRARWDTIAQICEQHRANGYHVLVVVSAVSGMTDTLKRYLADVATPTTRPASTGDAPDLQQFRARYLAHQKELGLGEGDLPPDVDAQWRRLQALTEHQVKAERASSFAWQADVYASGELFSSAIGAAYLRACGMRASFFDVRETLTHAPAQGESEWSRYLSAACNFMHEPTLGPKLASLGEVVVTQGFIARNADGETVILGRGGSDTSASYLGARLRAEGVEIWTDVPGMFSANPRKVPDARLLLALDYEEAQEIAATGAKVLHPRCLLPVWEAQIPIWVRDTGNPTLPGTCIRHDSSASRVRPSIKAVSHRSGIVLISMESLGMWQQAGFLADVFAIFREQGVSIDLIGTAETNVTVSLDPSENLLGDAELAKLTTKLQAICRVRVMKPCSAVTLVGRGIRSLLGRLRDLLAEIGEHNVHLITQSSNNLNFTAVVDEEVGEELATRLHELLIASGAMAVDDRFLFGPAWQALATSENSAKPAAPFWFEKRDELLALAEQVVTPAYVYDLPTVERQAQKLRGIAAIDQVFFAIKANSNAEIMRRLEAEGIGFECVSPGELDHVLATLPSLARDRILFTPNFAAIREYAHAFSCNAHVTLDNLEPLERWPEVFAGREVIARIDLGHGHGHHDKVRTGGARSKFGIHTSETARLVELAKAAKVRIVGLHAHLGSGVTSPSHWRDVGLALAELLPHVPDVTVLNLGGGFGVPYKQGDGALDITELAATLADLRKSLPGGLKLWVEPGRFLVASAGVILTRITQTKGKSGVRFVGVDAGMHTLIRPALYDAYHEIVNLTKQGAKTSDEPVTVVGPICESGDVLGSERYLPECNVGDVILVATAGAYGMSMASNYNLRGIPAEHCLA